jgi:hypothetical protein
VHSGALGGPLEGKIADIGLIYTTLRSDSDTVLIPNAALLNSALRYTDTSTAISEHPDTRSAPPKPHDDGEPA